MSDPMPRDVTSSPVIPGARTSVRERILASAREAFARDGVSGAKIIDIARRASVSKQTVYRQFGSEGILAETIYNEIIRAALTQLGAVVTVATQDHTPSEDDYWREATLALVKFFERDTELAALFFGPKAAPRARACSTLEEHVYPAVAQLLSERYGDRMRAPMTTTRQFGCSLLQVMHAYIHQTERLSRGDVVELILLAPAVAPDAPLHG